MTSITSRKITRLTPTAAKSPHPPPCASSRRCRVRTRGGRRRAREGGVVADCAARDVSCYDNLFIEPRMDAATIFALEAYSRGAMSALELRRRLGGATYGDVLRLLSEAALPLPRAPIAGREEQLERAREWMFPKNPA